MTEPSTSESNINVHYINKLQRELDKACKDTKRLDWMERTLHVLCYDNGDWFCASRKDPAKWIDGPMASTLRGAIDAAILQETGDGPREDR